MRDDGSYPDTLPESAVRSSPRLVVIANPTNTTGQPILHTTLRAYLDQIPDALFIIDEAYIDYASDKTVLPIALSEPRLLVLRSLSKGYGLPGLRVGMAYCCDETIITALASMRYTVCTPWSIHGAVTVLNKPDILDATVQHNLCIKSQLAELITMLPGLSLTPTVTNFLLVQLAAPLNVLALQRECDTLGLRFWWFNETPLFKQYFGTPCPYPLLRRAFRVSPVPEPALPVIRESLQAALERICSC